MIRRNERESRIFVKSFSSMMTTNFFREPELRKLTIPQLKKLATIPTKLKKKDDIVGYLLNMSEAVNGEEEDHSGKRAKKHPIFSTRTDCELCSGNGTVWCELGIARCPLCRPAQPGLRAVKTTPIKYESFSSGPYSDIVETVCGEISLRMDKVGDAGMLTTLVAIYGFGICESIEALVGLGRSEGVDKAVERLIEKTRDSAENYSLAQAQLNSEEVRESARSKSVAERKSGRERVVEDVSVLNQIDEIFCRKYETVLAWMVGDPETNSVLVYDYLVLRRDSVKWFKEYAEEYFDRCEKEELVDGCDMRKFFTDQIARIQEAVFCLPSSGGQIPALFRNDSGVRVQDEEIEMISLPTSNALVVIIED